MLPKQFGLPGLPTIGALMLTAILTVWLGIWGPISIEALKGWQTLIDACVALGGGALAYIGAMAKVNFDREVHIEAAERRKLGIYMRLRFPLSVLQDRANSLRSKIGQTWRRTPLTVEKVDLRLPWPPELDEAWQALDTFPIDVAWDLGQIRNSLRDLLNFLDSIPDDTNWLIESGYMLHRSGRLVVTERVADKVIEAAGRMLKWLEVVTEKL